MFIYEVKAEHVYDTQIDSTLLLYANSTCLILYGPNAFKRCCKDVISHLEICHKTCSKYGKPKLWFDKILYSNPTLFSHLLQYTNVFEITPFFVLFEEYNDDLIEFNSNDVHLIYHYYTDELFKFKNVK